MILINTTDQDIWLRQPLLAAELFEVEGKPQQYHTKINCKWDEFVISFLTAHPGEDQEQVENNIVNVEENPDPPNRILSQWNIQSMERGLTLGWPMIL